MQQLALLAVGEDLLEQRLAQLAMARWAEVQAVAKGLLVALAKQLWLTAREHSVRVHHEIDEAA